MHEVPLLQRQRSLLRFLTTPDAYERGADALADYPGLDGLDAARLALLGRLSLAKRVEKIEAILAVTLRQLGEARESRIAAFARDCPPSSPSRYDNAVQFEQFLEARWREEPPAPPWLPDVARFEIAFARARMIDVPAPEAPRWPPDGTLPAALRLRRAPGCELLRCAFDIRPLFDATSGGAPAEGRCHLAIAVSEPADGPRVFELPDDLYRWLAARDRWQGLADAAPPGPALQIPALLRELAGRGMVEIAA